MRFKQKPVSPASLSLLLMNLLTSLLNHESNKPITIKHQAPVRIQISFSLCKNALLLIINNNYKNYKAISMYLYKLMVAITKMVIMKERLKG